MLTQEIQNNYEKGINRLSNVDGVKIQAKGKDGAVSTMGTAHLLHSTGALFLEKRELEEEVFGPSSIAVTAENKEQLLQIAGQLRGHLTATIIGTEEDFLEYAELVTILEQKVGRLLLMVTRQV